MKMNLRHIFLMPAMAILPLTAMADIEPTATYTDESGEVVSTTEDFSGQAPLHVDFTANPSNLDNGASFEWHFRLQRTDGYSSDIVRYEENTSFDFTESGLTLVSCIVRFEDEIVDSASIRVTISESHLEFPNAFSPNGDGVNDIYKAKDGYKSIVEFHAYIFNRWGQKLYEWTDLDGGWDGTYNGHPVKDGVYFVLVKAKGADGQEYKIKRDVNLLRRFNEETGTNE